MKKFFAETLAYMIEALVILTCSIILKVIIDAFSSFSISVEQAILYYLVVRVAIIRVDTLSKG